MTKGQQSFSPSAFIPFCSFGGNMSVMGRSFNNFSSPICDKFKHTFLDGQLCYQVDVNDLRNKVDKKKMASNGIVLLLDYNFERTVKLEEEERNENKGEARIYIETLGNNNNSK